MSKCDISNSVDIMMGVTDEQCREMAQNLEFKGLDVHVHLHALKISHNVVMLVNLGCHTNQESI